MENLIIKILERVVCGKGMRRRRKCERACAHFRTGNNVVKGGGEVMMITKIKFFVQRLGRAMIIVLARDRGVFMNKLNSNAGTI